MTDPVPAPTPAPAPVAVERPRHPLRSAVVLVDAGAADGGPALAATLAAVAEAVEAGLVDEVHVVAGAAGTAAGAARWFVAEDPGRPGAAFAAALHAATAEVVVHLPAGAAPDRAWWTAVLLLAEQAHGTAVVAELVDPTTGEPAPRPPGLAFTGHPLPASSVVPADPHPTLLLGDVWAVPRRALVDALGFDPRLVPAVGLVDLGWRLWLAGAGARVEPTLALPSSTGAVHPVAQRWPAGAGRIERDTLAMLYRNYDELSLATALSAAVVLSPLRQASAGSDLSDLDGSDLDGSDLDGVAAFVADLDDLRSERDERQDLRRRPDAEIIEGFGDPLRPDCSDPAFLDAHRRLAAALPGRDRFGGRCRIVVATRDSLAPRMAGPGIRAWNIARELAKEHEVRLASLTHASITDPAFIIEEIDESGIAELVEWCDVFVFQGWVMANQPCFGRDDRIFVADVYDPMHLETLEQAKDDGEFNRRKAVSGATAILNDQLLRGDFFLCASEKQRDFWLGTLASLGRINPATYDRDPTLRDQIAVVPFGVPDEPPVRTRDAIKGVLPGVGRDDPVILWGGGVYNWFDPLTLIRAVDRLRVRIPDVKLVFLGMRHPNAEVPEMRMAVAARRLAAELGLVGSTVVFNEEWVAYEDRHNYLLDADIGVTTHLDHIETEFSFRTRVLDYLWCGLPTVATAGDALADLIEAEELGLTVPAGDVDALADALFRLLDDPALRQACRDRIAVVRHRFAWSVALRPVVEFCRRPRRAPDLVGDLVDERGRYRGPEPVGPVTRWIRYRARFLDLVRSGDWTTMVQGALRVARRVVGAKVRPGRGVPEGT